MQVEIHCTPVESELAFKRPCKVAGHRDIVRTERIENLFLIEHRFLISFFYSVLFLTKVIIFLISRKIRNEKSIK